MTTAPRLLDQVRDAIRRLHYSIRAGEAYFHWIKLFIEFQDDRSRKTAGAA